jgi:uncharacterized protein
VKRLLLAVLFLFVPTAEAQTPSQICFSETCVAIEIADTDAARLRGLQGRFALDEGAGMLFVFPQEDLVSFWMKDTLIPLDMIWLDRDLQVVDIKADVPPCRENPCPVYTPAARALFVLEINAGAAKAFNIKTGEKAVFK